MLALAPNDCTLSLRPPMFLEGMLERQRNTVITIDPELFFAEESQSPAKNYAALNPNRAFGKTSTKRTSSKRSVARKPRERTRHKTVLVVDDVADVTEMIALFLKHAGYDVTTADSAGQALGLAAVGNFDLIISDIGMPEMNGYELAESLRDMSDYQTTPIIAVTGYTEYDDRGRALRAGFNAHLTKPIDPSRLLDLINELMG